MDYKPAVELAREGKEAGFQFLYEATYQSKYYLALQYMKDEEAAKDVLQDSYVRAFSRLDQLSQPEAFSGWFGRIVANTAKNRLKNRECASCCFILREHPSVRSQQRWTVRKTR